MSRIPLAKTELQKLLEESLGFPVKVVEGEPKPDTTSLYCKGSHDQLAGPLHISRLATMSDVIEVIPMLRVMFEDAVKEADYRWRVKHQKRGPYRRKL